jgi:hypothetical protein
MGLLPKTPPRLFAEQGGSRQAASLLAFVTTAGRARLLLEASPTRPVASRSNDAGSGALANVTTGAGNPWIEAPFNVNDAGVSVPPPRPSWSSVHAT